MLTTLFLTAEEQAIYNALPATLQEGWSIEAETQQYKDTQQKRVLRFRLYRAYDPRLRVLMQSFETASSDEELKNILTNASLKDVSDTALAELFFTMGPGPISAFIVAMLKGAKKDEDIERIASLSIIRHALLSSLTFPAKS